MGICQTERNILLPPSLQYTFLNTPLWWWTIGGWVTVSNVNPRPLPDVGVETTIAAPFLGGRSRRRLSLAVLRWRRRRDDASCTHSQPLQSLGRQLVSLTLRTSCGWLRHWGSASMSWMCRRHPSDNVKADGIIPAVWTFWRYANYEYLRYSAVCQAGGVI